MDLSIRALILWPRNPSLHPRVLKLYSGAVNVITGESKRGKSALIPIIDYCLGSSKCAIPVGDIRTRTAWFGILLKHGKRRILLARREPEGQTASGDMYFDEGPKLHIPRQHSGIGSQYCHVDKVKERLNELAGLPALDFAANRDVVGYKSRPSFRDMAAFMFQPQHIVANPYTLFFKADTTEHREKLKTIFPLVLGAIEPVHLALQHELSDLLGEQLRLKRQIDQVRKASEVWLGALQAHYREARELGLLTNVPDPDLNHGSAFYLSHLSSIPKRAANFRLPALAEDNTARAAQELVKLAEEEDSLVDRLASLRRQMIRLERVNGSTENYGKAVQIQLDRLRPAKWLLPKLNTGARCPLCNSETPQAAHDLHVLVKAAEQFEEITSATEDTSVIFDREVAIIRRELSDLERKLTVVRTQRVAMEAKSEQDRQQRQSLMNVYRFVGRLEQSLDNYSVSQGHGDLSDRLKKVDVRIAEIKLELDPERLKQRLETAVQHIGALAAQYLRILRVDNQDMLLDIENLTLGVRTASGRVDYLWEIGSGSNWVGYHVAALIALHEHFLSLARSPVPHLLVLDQPSQVYFPETWPGDQRIPENPGVNTANPQPDWEQARVGDIEGVMRIFRALSLAVLNSRGKLQVVVLDHAGEVTWQGLDAIRPVERWREGRALIPPSWF